MVKIPIASISVGINDTAYRHRWTEQPAIRFAERDALAFSEYVLRAWAGARPEYVTTLCGEASTHANVAASFRNLKGVTADLFLVYFSGHGVGATAGQPACFCTADGSLDRPGIDVEQLDALLGLVRADQVLLLLDCCHAHGVVESSRFFAKLEKSNARLYICSTAGTERSWEDDDAKQGLFSAVLLETLREANAGGKRAIRVQEELMPALRASVPIAVDKAKHRLQEPIQGGSTREDILLPTRSGASHWRIPSALAALHSRVLSILRTVALGTIAILVVIQLLTYHIGRNRAGNISVSAGAPWLRDIWPARLSERVDTGIDVNAVSAQGDARWQLGRGTAWGVWMRRDKEGLREWIAPLEPFLSARPSNRLRVLLGGPSDPLASIDPLHPVQPWQVRDAVDAARLHVASVASDILAHFPVAPQSFVDHDQELLSLSTDGVVTLMDAAVGLFATNPAMGEEALERIRRLVAYRLAKQNEHDNRAMNAVAEGYARAAERPSASLRLTATLAALSKEGDHDRADRLLAAYACANGAAVLTVEQRNAVVRSLLDTLHVPRSEEAPVSLTFSQRAALRGLLALARTQPLDDSTLSEVWGPTPTARAFEDMPEVREFLEDLASLQPIPSVLRAVLLDRVRHPADQFDFFCGRAMLALARGRAFQSADATQVESALLAAGKRLEQNGTRITPLFAEVLGTLAMNGVDISEYRTILEAGFDPHWASLSESDDFESMATIVTSSDAPFVVAVARMWRGKVAPATTHNALYSVAICRTNMEGHEVLISFLADQSSLKDGSIDGKLIRNRLARHSASSRARDLEAEIAAQQLRSLSAGARGAVLVSLRQLWVQEVEPEVKLELGILILQSE